MSDPTLEQWREELAELERAYLAYSAPLAMGLAAGLAPDAHAQAWMDENRRACDALRQAIAQRVAEQRVRGVEPEPARPPAPVVATPRAAAARTDPTLDTTALAAAFPPTALDRVLAWTLRSHATGPAQAVASLRIPSGWHETAPAVQLAGAEFLIELAPRATTTARLSLYFRGRPMGADAAAALRAALAAPPHVLDADEADAVSTTLRDVADADWFALERLETFALRGRTVLVARGVWRRSGLHELGLFVAASADGARVEELHFVASASDMRRHAARVRRAIAGVAWRSA